MQAATWNLTAGGHSTAHDLCICAPTGSGKTLAYALPIVQGLAGYASFASMAFKWRVLIFMIWLWSEDAHV